MANIQPYWTQREVGLLDTVTTFEELVDIALIILRRMEEDNKPIVQICGPMSTGGLGNLEANMKVFQLAILEARKRGCAVFDQVLFQEAMIRIADWKPHKPYCQDILDVFYRGIFHSRMVKHTLFLPGWKTSRGSVWERKMLTLLSIPTEEYPEEWWECVMIDFQRAA